MKAPKSKLSSASRTSALPKRGILKKSSSKARSNDGPSASAAQSASTDGAKREKKRLKTDSLAWKPVNTSNIVGIDDGGGMMMLEELEDVGVEWEEAETGTKVAHFVEAESSGKRKGKKRAIEPETVEEPEAAANASADEKEEAADDDDADEQDKGLPSFAGLAQMDMDEEDEDVEEEVASFVEALMPAWTGIPLHANIKRALLASGFVKPTDIQTRAIPKGIEGRDVVGVAETGSGKTLAYSLPILSHLLTSPRHTTTRRPLSGLVLCPTRELALQVVDHLQRLVKHIEAAMHPEDEDEVDEGEEAGAVGKNAKMKGKAKAITQAKRVPRISIGSVVGGLSAHKQKRIVERGADVLVATPGRLWDLIKSDDRLAADTRTLRFLIIDEADRMIENGHFAELESIVRLTQRQGAQTAGPDDDDPVFAETSTILTQSVPREDMQTFVFSATLSKDLQQNLKKRYKGGKKGAKRATALEDLVEKLDFRDPAPEVIDLSPEGGVVKQLKESMVECIIADKDLYLYYFLLRYPGRSIIFVGSIDGIRRLTPLFEMLQMPVWPLHSQLQQKQRLKNLDRFKSSKHGALIATDVAARGLDIPSVDHVIHFNLPRTADAYIHRSGRTARAQNPGFALQIVSPEDRPVQRGLMKSLGRSNELPELPIESGFLPKLKERIRIAREIEKAQHEAKKETHDRNWLIEAAEAMDIDLDPSMLSDDDETFAKGQRRQGKGKASTNVPVLKAQLKGLLAEPLLARGVSARYPTSGSKVIVDDLIAASGHGTLLGANTAKAWDEVHKAGRKIKSNKRKKPAAASA